MSELDPKIKAIIDANSPPHLREYLYRMTHKESGGNPNAGSKTGASGLLQFTKGTGSKYGLVSPTYDARKDPQANIIAGVQLTEDNRAAMSKLLGREPTNSELALGHQQGAGTAARMILNTGNASTRNLAVNNVPPGLPPAESARHIMNYYGFDKKLPVPYIPGVTLDSNPVQMPGMPPAVAPAPVAPATPIAEPDAQAAFRAKAMGADGKGGPGTPYAMAMSGTDDLSKGLRPQVDPQAAAAAAQITPMSGGADMGGANIGPQAQALLSQLMQARRQRYGLTLPGGMP